LKVAREAKIEPPTHVDNLHTFMIKKREGKHNKKEEQSVERKGRG